MKHYCGTGNNPLVAARSIGIVVFCQCKASTIFRTLSAEAVSLGGVAGSVCADDGTLIVVSSIEPSVRGKTASGDLDDQISANK